MDWLTAYGHHVWHILTELAPWLLFGLVFAGVLHLFLSEETIRRQLGGHGWASVLKAVALGVPMPLCSCGVIPAALALRRRGASPGASMGFLISTPQTGVDSFFVTIGFLGLPFAFFKVVCALISGFVGGMISHGWRRTVPESHQPKAGCCSHHDAMAASVEKPSPQARTVEALRFAFISLLGEIYHWLVLGVLIAALLSTAISPNYFADSPLGHGWISMLAMLALSIPLYVCSVGSVPMAAALVAAGVSPGAALVFLMAGPTTNVATMGAVFREFGGRLTAVYIGTVVALSLVSGALFNQLLSDSVQVGRGKLLTLPTWLQATAAVALIVILAWHGVQELRRRLTKPVNTDKPCCHAEQ